MTDAEILQGLFFFLMFVIGCITCLVLLYEFICFLVRPVYRWLTTSKHERLLEDLIRQLNQASDDYLNDILASINNQRR